MKSNITKDGYVFSIDKADGQYRVNVLETAVDPVFAAAALSEEAVEPCHVTEMRCVSVCRRTFRWKS